MNKQLEVIYYNNIYYIPLKSIRENSTSSMGVKGLKINGEYCIVHESTKPDKNEVYEELKSENIGDILKVKKESKKAVTPKKPSKSKKNENISK